jgi:U5 small nuclear ribonucleoprotein component
MSSDQEEEMYDEFGNYIGPDLDDSSSDEEESDVDEDEQAPDDASDVSDEAGGGAMVIPSAESPSGEEGEPMQAIVLHEDKVHYPSATEVYGEDVRTAVLDEDAMDLDVPLVEPLSTKTNRAAPSSSGEPLLLDYVFSDDYLTSLISNETTRTRRGVALVGHLHSGKTTFVDFLLEQCQRQPDALGPRASLNAQDGGGPRYTDTLGSEQDRQMSLVSTPLTTILPDSRGKSYCVTLVDCPGHVNFHDESVAALRAVDGAVIVLDAVEGIMLHTEMVIKHAISEGLPLTLLINKVDRLIVELKLPPRDAYYKLLSLVESVNQLVQETSRGRRYPKLSPERGNVAFASAQHGWCFTVGSFANLYNLDENLNRGLGDNLSDEDLAKRLWGDAFLDPNTGTFHKRSGDCPTPGVERTFVKLVLEPIYKIYTACLGERERDVGKLLRSVGVLLSKDQLRASARPLLRAALSRFFATASAGFVDMLVQHV